MYAHRHEKLSRGRFVLGTISAVSVLVGATVAYVAGRHPRYRRVMETMAGLLLIAGFALLGYSLELVLGPLQPN